jgi:hypothetical protein
MKTTLAIIPGGLTCMLQPLDVSINKPMKTLQQRRWNQWYAEGAHTFTAAGRMRKPELTYICQWIVDAWQEIDPSIIIHAFKKCCISNAMDGSEDDVVWDHQPQQQEDNRSTDETSDEAFYDDSLPTVTDKDLYRMFDSDSDDDDEFEGFEPMDVRD